MSCWRTSVLITALLMAALPVASQQIPKVDEQSLGGKRVVLPNDASGRVAVLILGFTRASKTPTTEWAKKLASELGTKSGLVTYTLPVLQDVPGIIRGMVISGMKHDVPESQRAHFVPVLHNEAEWKKLVNYSSPDDAYLVVLDPTGSVAYQMHGPGTDANYSQLRQRLEVLLK